MRIGHAVEHQQQRRTLDAVEQLGQVLRERQVLDAGHHALVALGMREPPEARLVGRDQPDPGLLRGGEEIDHAAIAPRLVVQDLGDRRRIVAQPRGDRVKTVENLQT